MGAGSALRQDVARRLKFSADNGGFGREFIPLVLAVCSLAVVVVMANMIFVKMTSAIVSAITTPFKDLCTVVFSDMFVDKRVETPQAVIGFAIACVASLAYNVHDVTTREDDKAGGAGGGDGGGGGGAAGGGGGKGGLEEGGARSPLLRDEKAERTVGGVANIDSESEGDGGDKEIHGYWLINDAYCIGFICCGAGTTFYAATLAYYFSQSI